MSTAERLPACEITDAEIGLVLELYGAGRVETAREVVDYLMEKRWPEPAQRVEPPTLVHLDDYRRTNAKPVA